MKTKLLIVSIIGASAVAFGALGAHALKSILTETELQSFHTAVRYQIMHALFLLLLIGFEEKIRIKVPFTLALLGIILFSGSIYLLVLDEYFGLNLKFLGPITPIGGMLLITSWLTLGIINYRMFK